MRRQLAIILVALLSIPFASCASPQPPPSDDSASEPVIQDSSGDTSVSVAETEPVEAFDPAADLDQGDQEIGRGYFYGENRGRCLTCHTLGGEGEPTGYALDDVGLRREGEWLASFIHEPRILRPEVARMPPFRGDEEASIADIVAFLLTLETPVDHPESTDVKPEDEPEPHVGPGGHSGGHFSY